MEGYTTEQQKTLDGLRKIYEVKNVKTFRGMEGQGFNLTLYKNGKKLCTVDDSAYGGDYDFSDWDVVKEMNEELKQSMGKIKCVDFDIELPFNAEYLVNVLVDEFLENKSLKAKCRKHTLVVTTECKEGEFYEWKYPFDKAGLKEHLKEKYGDRFVEFINDRFIK